MHKENAKIDWENQRTAAYDLIYLAGCTVNQVPPDPQRVEKMDLEQVHSMSCSHDINALIYMALEAAYGAALPNSPFFQAWAKEKDQAIYKSLLFDEEREQVLAFLESAGIWYLPLKGILLKDFYPKVGMRQMADNDILFDTRYQKQVRAWFLARGYEEEHSYGEAHDAYYKKPVYNFEMHKNLFETKHNPKWHKYYENVKERLLPTEGTNFGYHFTDEDFYIYIITHEYKHYSAYGIGIRSLLDCYVYTAAKETSLDWTYIQNELAKMGVDRHENAVRNLAQTIFSAPAGFRPDDLTERQRGLLDDFLFAGVYGSLQNYIQNKSKTADTEKSPLSAKTVKLNYIRNRLFPDLWVFEEYYPFFYQHKWLIPVGYIYRIIHKAVTRRKKLLSEIKTLWKI